MSSVGKTEILKTLFIKQYIPCLVSTNKSFVLRYVGYVKYLITMAARIVEVEGFAYLYGLLNS